MKKKIIAIFMATMMSVSIAACGSSGGSADAESTPEVTEEAEATPETTPETTATPEVTEGIATPTPEEQTGSNSIPAIVGSQVYDIILSLSDMGIPEAEAVSTSDGFQFDSTTDQYSYSITTNSSHEVMSAQFFVLSGEDARGYLQFCATMPYDSAESETAQQWVNSNIGTEAETTIGDATYTLSTGTQGPILTIKALGYDDYILKSLM